MADEQELLDEIRRRMHVDRRRRDGNHDRLRARQQILKQQARRPGGRVDDELARVARYHAPAVREPCPADARRKIGAVDLARVAAALREPVQAGALGVEVGNRRRDVASREVAGEIRGDRALADATLGVDHQRRVHRHLAASLRLEKASRARSKRMNSEWIPFAHSATRVTAQSRDPGHKRHTDRAEGGALLDHACAPPRAGCIGRTRITIDMRRPSCSRPDPQRSVKNRDSMADATIRGRLRLARLADRECRGRARVLQKRRRLENAAFEGTRA